MRRERLVNDFETTLATTCTIGASTIQVTDAGNLPLEGDYRLVIDAELLGVTGRSGNVLSVIRAEESTVAVEHAAGAKVRVVITTDSLNALRVDRDPLWTDHAAIKPLRCFDAAGGILEAADFTGVNLGARGSLADSVDGSLVATVDDNSPTNGHHIWEVDAPSTPYKVTLGAYGLWRHSGGSVYPQFGIHVGDSTSGDKLIGFNWLLDEGNMQSTQVVHWTNPTTYSSVVLGLNPVTFGPIKWLQFYDDNTFHKFSISYDGIHWIIVHSQSRTAWLSNAGDKVGFYFNAASNNSGALQKVTVRHFSLEEL